MLIEYRIRYHSDGVTITQRIDTGDEDANEEVERAPVQPDLNDGALRGPALRSTFGRRPTGGGTSDPAHVGGGTSDSSHVGGGTSDSAHVGGGTSGRALSFDATPHEDQADPDGSPVVILGPVVVRGRSRSRFNSRRKQVTQREGQVAAKRFELETQRKSQWCWASVVSGVDAYFSGRQALSQCEVAGRLLQKDCCSETDACNTVQALEDVFPAIDRQQPRTIDAPLSFELLKREIDVGRLVCARIGWSTGGGHFVVIYGYRESVDGRRLVLVSDPFYADSILEYDTFVSQYQTLGSWTVTFFMGGQEGLQ